VFSSPPGLPATAFTTNDDLQGSIAAFCSAAASKLNWLTFIKRKSLLFFSTVCVS
jgi:hypothetical protein